MKLRKIGSILLVLMALLTVCTTPGVAADGERLHLGFSLSAQDNERWIREEQWVREFCEANDIEFTFLVADSDAERQYAQVETMISNGVDAVMLRPVDSASAGNIANMVHDAGATYLAYDVMTLNGHVDYYVTFDSVLVGREQAEELLKVAPKGNWVMINGSPASTNAQDFYNGAMEVLQPEIDAGNITIVADQWCPGYSTDDAARHTENALTANNNDIQAILVATDSLCTAVLAVLEPQGLAGKVALSGQDGELIGCQRIVEGTQAMTVYKPIKKENQAALDIIYAAMKGEDADSAPVDGVWATYNNGFMDVKGYKLAVVAVTKDNINETVIADGHQTIENVYKNVPKDQWPSK